ncbi:MAG TPA: hypothetical protein VMD28_01550 [Acidimicrobiales bacterium]|nr:hypothetical protein [Acidimicrobiales bacterium]
MDRPSSRGSVVAVAAAASACSLVIAAFAPGLAGGSAGRPRVAPEGAVVKLDTSKEYGRILVNASGRSLYFLTSETTRALKCTGGCLDVWPPLLTKEKPVAGSGVAAKELGTVKRGASLQVTYYGHPLYLYAGDKAAGDANGEGIGADGGTWYLLGGTGSAVKVALTSSTGGSGGSGGGW